MTMKYNLEKHAASCNEFTEAYVNDLLDKIEFIHNEPTPVAELKAKTNNLQDVHIVVDACLKRGIDPVQIIEYMRTKTNLDAVEVIAQ